MGLIAGSLHEGGAGVRGPDGEEGDVHDGHHEGQPPVPLLPPNAALTVRALAPSSSHHDCLTSLDFNAIAEHLCNVNLCLFVSSKLKKVSIREQIKKCGNLQNQISQSVNPIFVRIISIFQFETIAYYLLARWGSGGVGGGKGRCVGSLWVTTGSL